MVRKILIGAIYCLILFGCAFGIVKHSKERKAYLPETPTDSVYLRVSVKDLNETLTVMDYSEYPHRPTARLMRMYIDEAQKQLDTLKNK